VTVIGCGHILTMTSLGTVACCPSIRVGIIDSPQRNFPMQSFHFRDLKTSASQYFHANDLTSAINLASVHFFGEAPASTKTEGNDRWTLIRSGDSGNVVGRLALLGVPTDV
jgi:hypothetical protein